MKRSTSALGDPRRLARLADLRLLDSPRDEVFDRLTRLAARTLHAPMAIISVVDEHRQWFKSSYGLSEPWHSARETPLSHSFCQHVVTHEAPLVVADARAHPLVRDSMAIADMGIVAYLGVPLGRDESGVIGSFAVADRQPREWTVDEVALLSDFAELALGESLYRADARRIEEREARWRTLLEAVPIGLYLTDAGGRLSYVNPALMRMFGRDESAMLGTGWLDTVHPADRDEVIARWENAVARERDFVHEYRVTLEDGSTAWVRTMAHMRRDLRGSLVGAVGALEDVTARRALETRLRHAQKLEAVGRLAGGVAHDFNNLLTAILGSAELALEAQRDGGDSDSLRLDLEEIRTAAGRGAMLTRQLLAFAGRQTLHVELLDVNAVVHDAERLLRRLVGERIRIRLELHDEPLVAIADRGQLEQVLINMAANARDAMVGGGTLTIASSPWREDSGSWIRVQVRDTGVGMDEATSGRVFEPFFTTKRQGEGTGLGLATVYGIIEQLGGSVSVRSIPGAGTTFEILLPREKATLPEPRRATPPLPRTGVPGAAGAVLLVEDEAPLREILRRVLEGAGYQVVAAADGVDALDRLHARRQGVDFVVTDLVMPRMGGAELARRLRQEHPSLPVFFMTGYAPEARTAEDELPPDAAVLAKPFTPDRLLQFVAEARER